MRKTYSLSLSTAAAVLVAGMAFMVAPVSAEQTRIPLSVNPETRAAMDLPHNGQTADQVRSQYGAPQSTQGPVGTPPISQWDYAGFIVYFEGNRVIHAVVKPAH